MLINFFDQTSTPLGQLDIWKCLLEIVGKLNLVTDRLSPLK